MIDINDIAALLHVEDKLRAHGDKYRHMLAAVRAKLDEHEATHTPEPKPKAEAEAEPVTEDEATEDDHQASDESEPRRRL